ncbi:MAG: BsuBI/PstI family type II restriction endonuclease [Planctomycetota bacterium]
MSKKRDAQKILSEIGMPKRQQNEISALTLLALAGIEPKGRWARAKKRLLRIHDIMVFCSDNYHKTYAENTREVFRRQVIHQFEHARLVDKNPDDPERPTNSGKTCYALTDEFLSAIRHFGTDEWGGARDAFIAQMGKLRKRYARRTRSRQVRVEIGPSETIALSPGKHNELQATIVKEFVRSFVVDGKVLYVGDTAKKLIHIEEEQLRRLAVPTDEHGKFPDIILYSEKQERLFLVEAVTSHGPVTPKRKFELNEMLDKCPVGLIYVSAFATFRDFRKRAPEIAWETEVWVAEQPSHMIHFNGVRFLP